MTDADKKLMSLIGFRPALDNSGISLECAQALCRLVLSQSPTTVIEVGMANGASTLADIGSIS